MVAPFVENPLGGILGIRSASFFKLDPTGTVPTAGLGELINPLNPNKVAFDVTDSEDYERGYAVTTNPLQDFTSATSNVHKSLERITVSGTLVSSIDLALIGSVGVGGIPGFGGSLRADLLKIANLETIADEREPIMFISPRVSMPKAFIESIARSWSPDLGENTILTVTLVEARIVNPLTADVAVPDVAGSFTGNNATSPAGTQAAAPVTTQTVIPSSSFGLPPTVIPFF
jgi:hypothetical protein